MTLELVMRRPWIVLGPLVLLAGLVIGPQAFADVKSSAQCGREFDQCQAVCNEDRAADASKRAPCVAKCATVYAACDAGVAYDKAKPWIEEQARKTKKFLDELIEKYAPKTAPPAGQDKSKSI